MQSRFARALYGILGAALLAACDRSGPASAHETLTSLDPLRSTFNADSGKVRAIFLASPT